jgi:hypothetical protein
MTHLMCTANGLVARIGWKDNAFALMMSTTMDGSETVTRNRKRPKKTRSKAKTARIPFGNLPRKDLEIPKVFDEYNMNMHQVDNFDHLTSNNPGFRRVRRRGYQAVEHSLLRMVLVNTYLLSLYSDIEGPREITFRSQQAFRINLIDALLHKARAAAPAGKRRISHISAAAEDILARRHELVKRLTQKDCVCCKGLRMQIVHKRGLH